MYSIEKHFSKKIDGKWKNDILNQLVKLHGTADVTQPRILAPGEGLCVSPLLLGRDCREPMINQRQLGPQKPPTFIHTGPL